MHKILNAKNDNWNSIDKWWLKKYDQIYNTEYFLTTCSDFKGLQINKLPIYYQNLLKSWSNFLLLQKPMTKVERLDNHLYGNSNIVFNGKPIFFPNLHRVEYIKSVIYGIVKQIILKIQILYLIH
jgi:hypothetical protein